jgi:hypothetical protein
MKRSEQSNPTDARGWGGDPTAAASAPAGEGARELFQPINLNHVRIDDARSADTMPKTKEYEQSSSRVLSARKTTRKAR